MIKKLDISFTISETAILVIVACAIAVSAFIGG